MRSDGRWFLYAWCGQYPLVTNLAFDAFSCYQFEDTQWLKADVSIQCHTAKHDEAIALAVITIIVYPVGLLVLFAGLLFCARRAITSNRPTPLSKATSFLHREYETNIFWWEVCGLRDASDTLQPRLYPCLHHA